MIKAFLDRMFSCTWVFFDMIYQRPILGGYVPREQIMACAIIADYQLILPKAPFTCSGASRRSRCRRSVRPATPATSPYRTNNRPEQHDKPNYQLIFNENNGVVFPVKRPVSACLAVVARLGYWAESTQ
jgi:hypothetical protein